GVDRGMSSLEANWRDGVQIGEGPRRTTSTRPGIGSLEDLLGLAPAPAPQPFTGLAVPGGTVMPGGVFVPSNCPLWVVDLNWVLISLWAVFPEPVRLPERPGRGSPSPRRVEPLPSIDHETLGLLLRQLYGLPVEIPSTLMSNGLELPVVSFEEAQRVISSGQIVNYHLDPFLQPWA